MFFRSNLLYISSFILAFIVSFSVTADIDTTPRQGIKTITLEDASNVSDTIAELEFELEKQGFIIPLTVNHSGAAASIDLDLAPNQVIFARPPKFLEKRLLQKSDTIGIDLPLKILVFEDDDGSIKLSVNTLGYLIDRHNIGMRDFVLRMTDKLIEQFSTSDDEGNGLISIESLQSVDDTVQSLQDAISVNPSVRIPLILDYKNSNTKRRHRKFQKSFPILIVFGNPNVGTPLMQADPRMGIDLPLKFLVWKNQQDQVNITYNDPHFIAGRINLQGQNERLDAIANTLKKLAMAGAGENP